jgi:outer membrane protein OmpA-like peptidoglycan-associated protein
MNRIAWNFAASMMLAAATTVFAEGPLVVESDGKIDPKEVAKILSSPQFKTRSIRDSDATPDSVALRIPFAFGSAKLPDASANQLQALSEAIRQSGVKVLIEGHTDSVGNADYNQRLSQSRANAVRNALVASYGVPPGDLRALGIGKSRPLPGVEPESGANRRVEFRADR